MGGRFRASVGMEPTIDVTIAIQSGLSTSLQSVEGANACFKYAAQSLDAQRRGETRYICEVETPNDPQLCFKYTRHFFLLFLMCLPSGEF